MRALWGALVLVNLGGAMLAGEAGDVVGVALCVIAAAMALILASAE